MGVGAVPSVSVKSGTFEVVHSPFEVVHSPFEVVHSLPPLKKKTVEGRSKLSEGDGEGEVEEVLNLWWA